MTLHLLKNIYLKNISNTNDEVINPDIYVASENTNILISKSKIHYDDDSIDLPVNNSDGHVAKPLFNTILHTRIYKDSGYYDSTSFDKIAKLLYNKGVPLNKTIKVIGSIIYNGIPVSVTNLKIISDNNNSDTPLTVVFSVDKEFRLPNDIFDNNDLNFTHNNTGNEYDQFVKKGLISNYDIDTLDRFEEINNIITKCNFTIVCDQ